MTEIDILNSLREISSNIMNISPDSIDLNTKQDDIPEWDSLAHLRLIMSIEEELSVKFSMIEIPKYKSIEALVAEIKKQKGIE